MPILRYIMLLVGIIQGFALLLQHGEQFLENMCSFLLQFVLIELVLLGFTGGFVGELHWHFFVD